MKILKILPIHYVSMYNVCLNLAETSNSQPRRPSGNNTILYYYLYVPILIYSLK